MILKKSQMGSKTIIIVIITSWPLLAILLVFWPTEPSNLRLPTHIWPKAYNITIQPFMEEEDADLRYTFLGDVQIRIQSVITTKNVIMHSRNLNYTSIEYWAENSPLVKRKIKKMHFDNKTERMMFELRHNLKPMYTYILHFKYTGLIKNEAYGVFKNEYKDENNSTRWIVATQFEPNEARSAFPCFDEPQFKASFRISIVRPKHMNSYSNTRRTCSYMKGKLVVDTFKTTPIMSVYLVAFLITPYEKCTNGNFAIIAELKYCNRTKYCFEQGQKILNVLGNYFNMSYYEMGVDKLSLVAIPNVNFNGMENWGLVLIPQNNLLLTESSTLKLKQEVTQLLSHELSHMWFGNLVTCDWWNSVWLNEGFATYFSYFSLELLESKQSHWEEFFFENVIRHSLSIDIGDILPISAERKRVSRDYFNSINYSKGASIIQMVRHIIGASNFQDFIRKYLQVNKYKTVTVQSFLNVMLEYSPKNFSKDLKAFLKSFTEQKGYPLITTNFFTSSSRFEIIQESFPESPSQNVDPSLIYAVPISFTTDLETNFLNTSPAFFLSTKNKTCELTLNSTAKWLIVNLQATWYYRVNYNEENWLNIGTALQAYNWSGIPLLNRAQIVDDIEHLFCIGKVNSNLALHVLKYLSTEFYYTPWKAALKYLRTILRHSKLSCHEIANLVRNLTDRTYSELGFENNPSDDLSTLQNREQIVGLACKYGNSACLAKVKYYYEDQTNLEKLPNHLQHVVYCTSIREGNETIYEKIFQLYRNKNEHNNKHIILKALGCTENSVIIEKHFWNIMSSSVPKDQKMNALESLYSESDSNAFRVYKLITLNYKNITNILGKETTVAEVISKITKYFSESFQKQDLINFSKMSNKINCEAALKIVENAIEILNTNKKCF